MQHGMRFVMLVTLLVTGCARQGSVDLQAPLPETAALPTVQSQQLGEWCQAYLPSPLKSLTYRALKNNHDLSIARANLREAQASARAAGASRLPNLNLEGSASRSRLASVGGVSAAPGRRMDSTISRYRLGVAMQYELDFWGRVASEAEAVALQADASWDDLQAARVTLSAEVAQRWFELVAIRQVIDLLQTEVAAREQMLELVQLRFAQGQAQGLDVVEQRQQTETIQGELALTQAQAKVVTNELQILLGESPLETSVHQQERGLPPLTPLPLEGIPANLLQLRPDLSAAGKRMAAADQQAAAAVAERLPMVQLTAEAFGESRTVTELFEQIFWNLLGSVNVVVFDGGRLKAQAEMADAQAEAAMEQFAQAYLTALAEVGNGLVLEQGRRSQLNSLRLQAEDADRALALSRTYYLQGVVDYLRVLNAQQQRLHVQQSLIEAQRELLASRLQTCRALGYSAAEADLSEGVAPPSGASAL